MALWAAFFFCTSVIVYSGTKLSQYGDVIAEKSGLGRTWVGVVLLASVTSLPELVTGLSSVLYANTPDIAVGDAVGSCVFNILILAMLDAVYRAMPISTKAHEGHVLSAAFGVLLLSVVATGLFFAGRMPAFGWIGPYSLVLAVVYMIAMRIVFTYERRHIAAYIKEVAVELRYEDIPARRAITVYAVNALLVATAAVFLPGIGKGIAASSGLGETFVGNILIALSTSLPEVVVSLAAVRMDAVDIAIGNLLGSNIFNMLILAVDDFFYTDGPLLSHASGNNIISAVSAIAMTAVVVIGLTYRVERKRLFMAWDSLAIVLIYISNIMVLYMVR